MRIRYWAWLPVCLLACGLASAEKPAATLPPGQLETLHKLIGPQPGEAKWASVPWRTDLSAARRESAARDSPLFVWRAGGGGVLGRA